MLIDKNVFLKFYRENAAAIEQKIPTHPINEKNFTKWVELHNPNRTENKGVIGIEYIYNIAKEFKRCTRHVSFNEFNAGVDNIIADIRKNVKKNEYSSIVLVPTLGDMKKSNFWITTLFMSRLSDLITHVSDLDSLDTFDEGALLIIPDDVSYSGKQYSKNISSKIYEKKLRSTVYIAIPFMSRIAKILIVDGFKHHRPDGFKKYVFGPYQEFKRFDEMVAEPLKKLILTKGTPKYTIYFDHKLADGISIYQTIYAFGKLWHKRIGEPKVMTLIENCDYTQTPFIKNQLGQGTMTFEIDIQDVIKPNDMCPKPFYKLIRYTYNGKEVEKLGDIRDMSPNIKFPKFILGPISLTRHIKGDIIIYVFGESHYSYNENEFKCSDNYLRITEFLKNLISSLKVRVDLFLEKQIKLCKSEIDKDCVIDEEWFKFTTGELEDEKAQIILKKESEKTSKYDLDTINDLLYDCARLRNKNCPYEMIRVHSVDLRVANIPTLPSYSDNCKYPLTTIKNLKNFIGRVPKIIGDIKSGRNEIYEKVFKQIKAIEDVDVRNLLLKDFERAKSVYDVYLHFDSEQIGSIPYSGNKTLFEDVGIENYKEFLQSVVDYCKNPSKDNFDKAFEIVMEYIRHAFDMSNSEPVTEIITRLLNTQKDIDMKGCYSYLHDLIFELGDIYNLKVNRHIIEFKDIHDIALPDIEATSIIQIIDDLLTDAESQLMIGKSVNDKPYFTEICTYLKYFNTFINNFIMELYLKARMMRSFKSKKGEWAGKPVNAIFYGGDNHSNELRKFLSITGFTTETFNVQETDRRYARCVDISQFSSYDDLFSRENILLK